MGCCVEPPVELALRRTLFFGLMLLVYLTLGGAIFSALPKRQQTLKCEKSETLLDAQRSEMLNVLWAETMAQSEHEWFLMANQKLDMYEKLVLKSCRRVAALPSKSFTKAFLHAFTLVTTIGFLDEENLSPVGKITSMTYAIIGIPLALLYLGQCSKMLTGLFPGNQILVVAFVTVFAAAILFDIIEESNDDTPFIDALFHVFLMMSTIGSCSIESLAPLIFVALIAICLVSVSYILIERYIEHTVQEFELLFSKYFEIARRWICIRDKVGENKIIEEEEEETELDSW